jgi:hypothetical protein
LEEGCPRIHGLPKQFMINTQGQINWKLLSIIAVIVVAGYRLFLLLWQFNFFHFLVPPSPDLAAHLQMTDGFIDGSGKIGAYPPLLHILAAFLAKIFHTGSLEIFAALAPYWIPLAIIVFYIMVVKLFDYRVAFWSTLVFGLVSSNPLLNFTDAQYADILGYNIIGPFFIIALVSLIKEFKYWKLFLVFVIFGVFLSAHNLSSSLIYIISLASIIAYCFVSYRSDRKQFRNAFYILIALCVGTVLFFSLSKVLFGPIIANALRGMLGGSSLNNSTSAVLDLDQVHALLVPFLEFLGMAGIGFLLVRVSDNKTRFASLFVVAWILVTWVFSRSEVFVLPQRLLRELSMPLSIAAGIFASDVLLSLKNNWLKIVFFGVFSYLILINNSQVTSSPFKLPDGFKNMVWYKDADQQKLDYITQNVSPGERIITNHSNPILNYKLQKAGYNVVYYVLPKSVSEADGVDLQEQIQVAVRGSGARYLFIGTAPVAVNPDVYYQQFVNYEEATSQLKKYQYKKQDLARVFEDGSELIYVR